MSNKTNVFLTGATGYLGGATLQLLMQKPDLSITALVRSKDKAAKLEHFGVKTVLGSLDDAALLEAEAAKADAIVQGASHDHINGVNALLKGAKARFEQTGKQPIFIQTSGTGAFVKVDAMGEYTSERVLSDMDPDLFDFKNTLSHNVVNDALLVAAGEGYVRTYILYPSMVYGVLKGPLVDAGIVHGYSIAIPASIKFSIQRGQGAMVGKGVNRWPIVHIDDTADFYKLIFERGLANEAPNGAEGIYALENGETSLGDAAKRYTAVLHSHGKSVKAEPEPFTADEIEKMPFLAMMGSNVRITADRARKLGWSPVHGVEEFYESVQDDVEAVLAGKN
ncbi:NAD(P)-binding protein [Peniophora sp. CONT]|nr:NAD(P)-binding protein [Peniophora sp. CONT]